MKAWENNIRQVVPYVPGEQPRRPVIKLNTNENPYPPAPGVQAAVREMDPDCLRLYPDPDCTGLCTEIAAVYGVEKENVFVGVGSDDVLAGGVIFANPNAPTAICEPLSFVEDILEHNRDVIVIADEAYVDFGGESAVSLLDKYDNLLVVQTFSKSRSMAGSRIGYALGGQALIRAMENVKFSINSYTMNQYSLKTGVEAIRDRQYFEDTLAKIIRTRETSKKRLEEMGFFCTDSKTNFLFVSHKSRNAKEIFEALKERDIYVRYFNTPGIDNYLRITVGTDEEMDIFFRAVEEILK